MPNSPTLLAASIAAAFGSFATLPCMADPLPVGGKVVAGQASISKPTPNALQVQQGSANAAIDWQSFSVGRDASVTFQQPSARSIVLNRVVGSDPSQILGRIQANGQVFLINPYGIVFGRDAKVDVAGLVASTANIRNDDFMAGRLRFTSPGQPGASVVNEGQITVREGGLAALMAPSVANRGTITARLGAVALASGEAFTLDPYGDRLIGWVVPASQLSSVVNEGTLSADGGSVQISARAAASVVDGVINLGGTVRARTVGERGGRVVLDGDRGVLIVGSIDASGGGAGELGGNVQVTGATIRLTDDAFVEASGDAGGGAVHIGGGWRGADGSGTVASTSIDRGARIDVSATTGGAGGEAVVWSDGRTAFNGRIDARGAAKGGQVEVSGHRLAYDGSVDAASAHGTAGTLLLDPGSLVVQSRTAAAPATGTDVVTTESVNTQLAAGTNVQLTATQDLTVADRIDARLVNASGTRVNSTGANLALTAGGNLALNNDVILDGGSFTATAGGRVTQVNAATLATSGGDVSLQAGQGITLQTVQGARNLTLKTTSGSIELATPIGLAGRFSADVVQAQAGDRVHLNGLIAASSDAQPAVAIDRGIGNSGAAAVAIDDHIISAGDVSIRGSAVMLASTKAIDTRVASGGRASSAVTIDAGNGGLALNGNVYTDNAAITLTSQGDLTGANAAAMASGSGAITLASASTTTVSRVQTTGALGASGARVVFDAGTIDTTVQAGTLQVNATGSASNAVDVRSSIKLGNGNSTITSANDFAMQHGTLIEFGATGALTIDAAQNIAIENLKSSGAGTLVRSAHGNVGFKQPLGGRAAGDTTTARTAGGDDIPAPTLYALDARAPEGRIETNGLLLFGKRGAPLTLDMPAPGLLAYGLNLAASEVDVRGLVFVFDGAVSIQGTTKLLVGDSIRSVGAYPMAIGGGEIDVYRPTRPDGSPYQNTDVVVAQYADGSLNFFEKLNGVWQTSTSFVSVVTPDVLPLPSTGWLLPSYWINRLAPDPRAVQVSAADFVANGATPVRLVSLPDALSDIGTYRTGAYPNNQVLDSYDPSGRNPFLALVYTQVYDQNHNLVSNPSIPEGTEVQALTTTHGIPGTRFVPKILITNDPGPAFRPGMVANGNELTTNVGRIRLNGNIYETDRAGQRLVADVNGGTNSEGDLRTLALKVVSFDTRSIYQDSRTVITRDLSSNATPPRTCTLASGTCLDDPTYPNIIAGQPTPQPFNDYARVVYGASSAGPRAAAAPPNNPVSLGFQAAGYLSANCPANDCERPQAPADPGLRNAYYFAGEAPKKGANPNAPTTSLSWVGPNAGSSVQPGADSLGRYEFFTGSNTAGSTSNPSLAPPVSATTPSGAYVFGLSTGFHSGEADTVKMNVSVTQTTALATFDAPTPTRTVLTMNFGILSGQGVGLGVDTTSAFKSSLPGASVGGNDGGGTPGFSTITPTLLNVPSSSSNLQVASPLPVAPASVPVQPPIMLPDPGSTNPTTSAPEESPASLADPSLTGSLADRRPDDAEAAGNASSQGAGREEAPLLVLGGRGRALSLDLGRSGGLGTTRSASSNVDYEVACTVESTRSDNRRQPVSIRRDVVLPACR